MGPSMAKRPMAVSLGERPPHPNSGTSAGRYVYESARRVYAGFDVAANSSNRACGIAGRIAGAVAKVGGEKVIFSGTRPEAVAR
jgi:hypothetical protein